MGKYFVILSLDETYINCTAWTLWGV